MDKELLKNALIEMLKDGTISITGNLTKASDGLSVEVRIDNKLIVTTDGYVSSDFLN